MQIVGNISDNSQSDSTGSNLYSMGNEIPTPTTLNTPSSVTDDFQNQISPTMRKHLYKKAKTDDMDK